MILLGFLQPNVVPCCSVLPITLLLILCTLRRVKLGLGVPTSCLTLESVIAHTLKAVTCSGVQDLVLMHHQRLKW